KEAIHVLKSRLTPAQMREVVGRDIERLVARTENVGGLYHSRIPDDDLASFLIDLTGTDLLKERALRLQLVKNLSEDQIVTLASWGGDKLQRGSRARIEKIVARKWVVGKHWARSFASFLGFPKICAGIVGSPDGPSIEEVEPRIPLPELHAYQKDLLSKVQRVMDSSQGSNRAILSLPTGAGKTRTAVEALLNWWNRNETTRPYIIWITQSDELCEQAAGAFREIWVDRGGRGPRKILRLFRYWGVHKALPDAFGDGVVIASIQKLNETIQTDAGRAELERIAEDTAVVVIDEAHHTLAQSYTAVLETFGIIFGRTNSSVIPLLGLTATPYRGIVAEENQNLARRFHSQLLVPDNLGNDPLHTLREMGILSHIDHQVLSTGRTFTLEEEEAQRFQKMGQLPDSFLQKVGRDPQRNAFLLKTLLDLPTDWPVLCFGCSLEHASALAVLLRRKGRSAAFISGETRRATRRYLIEEFRNGHLHVLCNYGVLTTGFDAPKIRAIAIARPTTSVVLYEQMIGRGMRGPLNGGTKECLVIDLADNITRFQGQMAYKRMEEYWK
ncbi:MAG: DEAD/DEAH box helicase, partial [Ktedonobacteraceae bacterium]